MREEREKESRKIGKVKERKGKKMKRKKSI